MDAGVEIISGDLARPESLSQACGQVETVISTATSMPCGADDGLRAVDREGTLALIDEAQRARVRRFVYVSYSGNIREDSALEAAKRSCEQHLLASTMETVILRPSYFMEMWLSPVLGFDPVRGSARIYGSGAAKVSYIASSNVADFAVSAVTRKYPEKHTILELGGPEPLSQLDAVHTFEQSLNKTFQVEHLAIEALEQQHHSTDALQKTFAALMLSYAKGDAVKDAEAVARQHDVHLRSVAQYANSLRVGAASSAV